MADTSERREADTHGVTPVFLQQVIAVAVLAATLTLFAYILRFAGSPLSNDPGDWGTFGDYLGGVLNPLFGFFGLIALLLTLRLQTLALKLSSEELALSRDELRKSAEALSAQNSSLAQQNFENTFFQLLRRFSEVADDLRHVNKGTKGRQAAQDIFHELVSRYREMGGPAAEENVERAYSAMYSSHHPELGQYFRTLFHLIKFVDKAPSLSDQERASYANIARAQLSTFEISLLFYNCTWQEGKRGFRPLVNKYGLLKHIDPGCLLVPEHKDDRKLFDFTAFIGYDERVAHWGGMRGTQPGMSRA